MTLTLPVVYLLASFALLAATVGGLYPRTYGHSMAPVASILGIVLTLFTPQFLVLSVALTAVWGYYGALQGPAGIAGFALHLGCWAVLLRYQRDMLATLPVLDGSPVRDDDHPFCEGLTDDERLLLRPGQVQWHPSLLLRTAAMLDVQVTRGVIYRRVGNVRLRLDVYRPRHHTGDPLPSVLYTHGGGWVLGTRRQSRFMMYELASAGFVVFSIQYRFAPWHPLPAALEDAKAALAWIREHAEEYGARPDHVVTAGGSAGGHLAAMLALTPNNPRFQPGFEHVDTRVQGAVVLYGVTDFTAAFEERKHPGMASLLEYVVLRARYKDKPELFRALNPASYLSADAPPMLLVHGGNDHVVPTEESRVFQRKLREAGARKAHYLEVPHGVHAFEILPTPLHQRALRVIVRFVASVKPEAPAA